MRWKLGKIWFLSSNLCCIKCSVFTVRNVIFFSFFFLCFTWFAISRHRCRKNLTKSSTKFDIDSVNFKSSGDFFLFFFRGCFTWFAISRHRCRYNLYSGLLHICIQLCVDWNVSNTYILFLTFFFWFLYFDYLFQCTYCRNLK